MGNMGADHSISITMKYYSHIDVPDKTTLQELLERIFGSKSYPDSTQTGAINSHESSLGVSDRTQHHKSQ